MDNKFVKFIRTNAIIIGPSTVVILLLVLFTIFGFSKPETTIISSTLAVTEIQEIQETTILDEYNEGTYTVDTPYFVLNPFDISPLTGLLMFESTVETQYKIVVKGKTDESDIEFTTPLATSHVIPVYGLYANTVNILEIQEAVVDGEILHTEFIKTEEIDSKVTIPDTIETTYEYFGDDLMLLMPSTKSLPVAVDFEGEVRWYLTKNLMWSPTFLDNGHLLLGTDRLMSDPYYVTGLYEIDYLGKIYNEYKIPGGYHHDAYELDGGNLLVLTSDFEGTVEDKIVEISTLNGEVVNTWDLEEILPVFDGMTAMWTGFDWFHNNSIDYNKNTDEILLSGRHQDAVISIDKTTGELNYIIGDPEQWGSEIVDQYFFTPVGEDFEWQYAQHSATFVSDNQIMIFDNGNNKSKNSDNYVDAADSYSRGVIYEINRETMTITQIDQFGKELGSAFYSPYISNAHYYDVGHYLVHSGGNGSYEGEVLNIPAPLHEEFEDVVMKSMTYEVQDGEVKYYLELEDNYYQAKRVSIYNANTEFKFGTGFINGELAETERFTGEYELKFSLLDTVPPRYELDLIKETDRLNVNITLDRQDEVFLLLVSDDETLTYSIPTSRTAYTAMCSSTFQGDERHISYYINETNISGDFSIYIVINNREYNTYNHVKFN